MPNANGSGLRVEIIAKACTIPLDERQRMERSLDPLREAVFGLPDPHLYLTCIHHPRSATYHVEAHLRMPGKTLFTGDRDAYLDSAFQRCVRKLVQRANDYRLHPDRQAVEVAARRTALASNIVAPAGPDQGTLGQAVRDGDYGRFRTALVGYEDWLRNRIGRWIQRFPGAEAQLGHGLSIGDLVEEVYLNAFEGYDRRPDEVPFHQWLDDLIDPSLKAMLRHPEEERENARMARSLRESPAEQE